MNDIELNISLFLFQFVFPWPNTLRLRCFGEKQAVLVLLGSAKQSLKTRWWSRKSCRTEKATKTEKVLTLKIHVMSCLRWRHDLKSLFYACLNHTFTRKMENVPCINVFFPQKPTVYFLFYERKCLITSVFFASVVFRKIYNDQQPLLL